ncbi:GntR family transcriptional regulator [Nocardia cyriacigeorgica]|uniref:GntR family transcriptional regulator n=1 Tax=Nocardia cyriacigeorgica TaxID=135487 RepID=UPI000CEA5169|nr:GntR family transcriptional regulator [Nocardia cyriacigeorgica]AVH21934.1 hypothetical protein C5B73_11200 [Nocardia cyriacigeorgica]MBF6321454.1 GntR family transcriptional regulator [Nocardia cyriacigeorgica]MBF6494869.1 GntR family transcriptional regulator [Nocardia cyriacigeorgica]PPJ09562.1 hypothetical protein C5E43_14595 [Nocardia cyriacigeorgica]
MSETDATLPKYLRIVEDIRGRIERGELGAGDEVESERELAVRWAVARPTAAKALNVLRQSGIVESRRGAGTFVARRGPAVRDGNPPVWVRGGPPGWASSGDAGERRTRTVVVISAEVAEPPEFVAEIFGSSGQVIMRRVVLDSEGGGQLRTTWYPHEFASTATRLLDPEPIPGDAGNYRRSALGTTATLVRERVCARWVAENECDHLGVESGAPVLVRQAVHYDAAGAVLWCAETVYPPDRWVAEPGARAER